MVSGEILASERPRLVRLCARLLGDFQGAEDAAQETLARAWRYRVRRDPRRPLKPWLDAIARNVCRNLLAKQALTEPLDENFRASGQSDPLAALEKSELLELLHSALDALPEAMREALTARYLDETPLPELARRLNTTDDALGVRLHRGRAALKSWMTRDQTPPDAFPDIETSLWCVRCGQRKLRGGFYTLPSGVRRLELRCESCFQVAQSRCFRGDGEAYLGTLKTLRPTIKHHLTAVHQHWHSALTRGSGRCTRCQRPVLLTVGSAPGLETGACNRLPFARRKALILRCTCGTVRWQWADELAFCLPEVQQLWERYNRIRFQFPAPDLIRIEALQSSAAVEVRTDPLTFAPLEVHTEGIPG